MKTLLITLCTLCLLILVGCSSTESNVENQELSEFAQCISQSGAVMYGAYWCPHCKDTKAMYENSFKYIRYVECDPRGPASQSERCIDQEIESYPTWIFGDGTRQTGTLSFGVIAERTGCEAPLIY